MPELVARGHRPHGLPVPERRFLRRDDAPKVRAEELGIGDRRMSPGRMRREPLEVDTDLSVHPLEAGLGIEWLNDLPPHLEAVAQHPVDDRQWHMPRSDEAADLLPEVDDGRGRVSGHIG